MSKRSPKNEVQASLTHLSFSAISEYRTCPKRYYYRRVLRAPEEKSSATLAQGSAVHRAVEFLHRSRLAGMPMPSVDRLLSTYDAGWKEHVLGAVPMIYPKQQDAKSMRSLAGAMLSAYRTFAQTDKSRILGIEQDISHRCKSPNLPLLARADLMAIEGSDLIVSDLKTSKCRWSETKTRESMPQLALYSVGARRIASELGLRKVRGRFVVLTKGKQPVVQVIEPNIRPADVQRLEDLIYETAAAVRAEVFPRREGWQCAPCYCPFTERCLGKKG